MTMPRLRPLQAIFNPAPALGSSATGVAVGAPPPPRFVILDSLSLAGTGSISAIAISGSHAFVVSRAGDSIAAIDISDPTNMALSDSIVGTTYDTASDIAILGTHAFVARNPLNTANDGVVAVDISDPTNLTTVSTLLTAATMTATDSVATSGSHAYVGGFLTAGGDGLISIDVSNPGAMTISDSLDLLVGAPESIAISGTHAFVACSEPDAFVSVDISNPAAMTIADTLTDALLFDPDYVVISGNYAYVGNVAGFSTSVVSVDISNPAAMTIVGSISGVGNTPAQAIFGAYVLGSNTTTDTVQAVSVVNPAAPALSSSVTDAPLDGASVLAVSGSHAFVGALNATSIVSLLL